MAGFCKTRVPEYLECSMELLEDDEVAVKEFGVQCGIDMCRTLLASGAIGLHFYTLNTASTTTAIIKGLRAVGALPVKSAVTADAVVEEKASVFA